MRPGFSPLHFLALWALVVLIVVLTWDPPIERYIHEADRTLRRGHSQEDAIPTLEVVARKSLEAGDPATALEALEDIIFMTRRKRMYEYTDAPEFWLRVVRVALEAEGYWRAANAAERYLELVDESDENRGEVLKLLEQAKSGRLVQIEAEKEKWADLYAALREGLVTERGEFPGIFADPLASGGYGPEMVVIPEGAEFIGLEGDTDGVCPLEIGHPFAVSRHEVTFGEWDVCLDEGGCGGYWPDDLGWGRGDRPVINVSWRDAEEYLDWLSNETGHAYRLLTDAEWEYAARAGTQTRFYWGDDHHQNMANCWNDWCDDEWRYTAPVASFPPNQFGLYDMHGNVDEFVEYTCEGPDHGFLDWKTEHCELAVSIGISWNDVARGGWGREWSCDNWRHMTVGFRVVRDMGEQVVEHH